MTQHSEILSAAASQTLSIARGCLGEASVGRLERHCVRARGRPGVAVVGETKTGKSALVNALVGFPGLVPVDADVATGVYIAIFHAHPAAARVYTAEKSDGIAIDIADVAAYASEANNPNNSLLVHAVEIGVPSKLLEASYFLIDTPGVGGLVSAHGEVTLAAMGNADAMLFTLDSSAPATIGQLDFLERALQKISTILVVQTKTDVYPNWRHILDLNRSLISKKVGNGRVSFAAVSSKIKLMADEMTRNGGDTGFAANLLIESGIGAVENFLRDQVEANAEWLHTQNLRRHVLSVLVECDASERARHAFLSAPSKEQIEAVERSERALRTHERTGSAWRSVVHKSFSTLSLDLNSEIGRRVEQIGIECDTLIPDLTQSDFKTRLFECISTGGQALWLDVDRRIRGAATDLFNGVLKQDLTLLAVPVSTYDIGAALPAPDAIRAAAVDESVGARLTAAWPMLGAISGANMLLAPILGPAALGVGLAAGVLMFATRAQAGIRAQAREFISRAVALASRELGTALQRELIEVRSYVEQVIADEVQSQRTILVRNVADLRGQLLKDQDAREQEKQAIVSKLKEIKTVYDDVSSLDDGVKTAGE